MTRSSWCQWQDRGCLQDTVQLLALEVAVGDAEAMVAAEFQQSLTVLIQLAITEMAETGGHACQSDPMHALKLPSRYRLSERGIWDTVSSRAS